MRDLCLWRFTQVPPRDLSTDVVNLIVALVDGLEWDDRQLVENFFSRVDTGYLNGDLGRIKSAFQSIMKTMKFLGFFSNESKLAISDSKGQRRSCLDAFGDILADKLKLDSHDRDLVVMQHRFIIEDSNKKQFLHTSTMM